MPDRHSQLRHDTPERQDWEELSPDGLDDEANVEDDEEKPAEEEALHVDPASEPPPPEADRS